MANPPILVSAQGTSVGTAKGKDITFTTAYPFHKLDSLNKVSFQLITLFFNTDPPNPDGSISKYQRNFIYSFPHGYNYVPSSWFLVMKPSGGTTSPIQTALGSEGVYITGGGSAPSISSTVLIVTIDTTNVNFYIDKYFDSSIGVAPNITGFFITIRSYIFVEDLSGTSVPSQS